MNESRPNPIEAKIGDGDNLAVDVLHKPGWVAARLYGRSDLIVHAYNPRRLPLQADDDVLMVKVTKETARHGRYSYFEIVAYSPVPSDLRPTAPYSPN